ncbi:MAG: acylneuraminate cytidylyltransferase family protein [Lutibacter sp.]|nr:acylneuraminate cytidylyltransferase family protein [Lutibacter sp.]
MKILAIIPARGGSKGVPGKNIKMLGGKPLIAYTIQAAKKAKLLTETILSTDSDEIIQVAQTYGLEVPFKRPASLATDESPTILTVLHALDYFSAKGIKFDAVCLLQVTNPFRTSEFIDQAIEKFKNSKADSLISVLKVPHEFNPHWVFEENPTGNLKISTGETEIIPRRQALPTAYYRDGSIYITKTEVLLNQKSFYGKSIAYLEADELIHVNIDTLADWEKAEKMLKNLQK